MKIRIELTKKQVVKALGKGYREVQLAENLPKEPSILHASLTY